MDRLAKTRKEKEVWEACQALEKSKANITYYAIGEQLIKLGYKRGSNSDIRRYLTTWKKHHTKTTTNSKKPLLPTKEPNSDLDLEHEPLRQTLTPQVDSDSSHYQELLSLAQHYAEQFDRLLKVNALLRQENKRLRKKCKQIKQQESKNKPKPRIRMIATVNED